MNSSAAAPAHDVILLAAGASRRLGRPKQLLMIDGQPLIRRMALAALTTKPRTLLVALGAEVVGCRAALADLPLRIIECSQWPAGMGATLAQATRALAHADGGLLVLGVDQPALTGAHLQALLAQWTLDPQRPVASHYAQTLGTPAIFPASGRAFLAQLSGDAGARGLLRQWQPPAVGIPAAALVVDIDDAHAWYAFLASAQSGDPDEA